MMLIFIVHFIINLSQQQENYMSYVLPKENQKIKGVIENIDEKIKKNSILGFGLWFKWQPFALKYISKTDPQCLEQFIFSLENLEDKKQIQVIYFSEEDLEYKLNIISDYFTLQEQISLKGYFEGVWLYFNSFFDFTKSSSIFYLYQSLQKEFTQLKIDELPIFQAQILYQIGDICDECVMNNLVNCFSPFQGRLSVLFEQVNFEESNYLNDIQKYFTLISDCLEIKQNLIIGSLIYDGNTISKFDLGILEKTYFQLSGWVKIIYDSYQNLLYEVFLIADFKDKSQQYNNLIDIYYDLSKQSDVYEIHIESYSATKITTTKLSSDSFDFYLSDLEQWHFIQLDVGYPDLGGTLKFYSNQYEEVIELQLDQIILYTGMQYGLYIGDDSKSNYNFIGTITDLVFKTFCESSEQELVVLCHQTCQTCFGPFSDNCLTCKSGSKHFLKNDQCICESNTFQFQEYEICQTIDDIFTNLNILEEELLCKQEGYDQCDDTIICSFGYFKYQEKYCIKCPYQNQMDSNPNVLCYNCLIDPVKFSWDLTCTTDIIQYYQEELSTFDKIQRDKEDFECFQVLQTKDQVYLEIIRNQSFNDPSTCKKGFYFWNEKCHQCGLGCEKCNSLQCTLCEDGYYLDYDKVCEKCMNCLTCELKMEQQICLSCPEKFYLKDQQCFPCGQFCANCRSNGYCNYCIDSEQYFISLDGINCLKCNISNCKYCYQVYEVGDQKLYTSFVLYLENQSHDQETSDSQIYCAKCQQGYVLELNTNTCIEIVNQRDNNCLCGYLNEDKFNFKCDSYLYETNDDSEDCRSLQYCKLCFASECIQCFAGFYLDLETQNCQTCPDQCEDCIQLNTQFQDNWKIEIKETYKQMKLKYYLDIQSYSINDYEIQCLSCPKNQILNDSNCIKGCDDECQKCEIINQQPTCVECKPFGDKLIKSLDHNGQCYTCQQNCELCQESSIQYLKQINQFFILNEENSIYTRSCYKPMPSKDGRNYFINQFTAVDCEKFNKCKHKGIFAWNIYCDIKQFEHIEERSGYFQQGNFFIDDFFEKQILNKVEIQYLLEFFNEQRIEEIEIILNFFQGKAKFCKSSQIEAQIFSKLIYQIFFFKGVKLIISGQEQNVLLKELNFQIAGFKTIQFENLNFDSNQINITDSIISSLSIINCKFGNNFQIQTNNTFNFSLSNVTIESTQTIFNSLFPFNFRFEDLSKPNISVKIDSLRIINSYFNHNQLIQIYTDLGQKIVIEINNLEIFESKFNNSSLFYSSGLAGINDILFGNLVVTNLKLKSTILKVSTLYYLPNVVQLIFKNFTIEQITLKSQSYLLLSNQFDCLNFYFNEVEIDQSYLFSNNIPLQYQKIYSSSIKIYSFKQISITNLHYTQEQSLLQIKKYNNQEITVDLDDFRIIQVSQMHDEQYFLLQEKSLIHISCSQCYLSQIEIHRERGYPEISIIDSQLITIYNSFFTQNLEQVQNLFNDCNKEIKNQLQYFIYIGQYQKVKIDNLTIIDAISLNYPFIILQGTNSIQQLFNESIEIINSKFENNKLITFLSNSPTSIISIDTEQKSFINLINLQFRNNHLNMKIQDLTTHSTSTFIIDTFQGRTVITGCLFEQNIVTNSSDSILYIKASVLEIINSRFIKNNILNFENLLHRIQQDTKHYKINSYDLSQDIQVLSNGGSGYLMTNYFSLRNCSIQESYSLFGGAFYVNTFGDAQIIIENSTFIKTSSSLQSSASSAGGCFYIDAQVSKLTLVVKNSTFNQSFSRSKGGCFFIQPSNTYNLIYFERIKIVNSYSTTSQFFDYSLQNLKNIFSNVTFFDIQIVYDKIIFYQFLGLLDNLSTDEATALLNNDPIIKIRYGNLTVRTVDCKSERNIYILVIDQGEFVNLIQITIKNGFTRNSPFMSLNSKSGFQGQLNIQNLEMNNLQEFLEMQEIQKCKEISIQNSLQAFCISPIFVSNNYELENYIEVMQQITQCQNQNLILNSEKQNFSLIEISNININHKIIIQGMFLNQIICRNCEKGLLSITNIGQANKNNIILNEIVVCESQCGTTGCLTIINKNSQNFLKTNYLKKENRILQQQNWEQLKSSFNFQVSLSNSQFQKNMAYYGGAICVIDINMLINQCQFLHNSAKLGGAIYSFTSEQQNYKTVIFNSQLIDNQAELASDIYLENQMLQKPQKLNIMMENNSPISGGIIFEKPRSLAISTNKGSQVLQKKIILSSSTKVIEKTIIKPYTIIGLKEKVETLMFPSGQMIGQYYYFDVSTSTNIPYNISLRIIALNLLNQKENQLNESICTLKHKVINLTDQVEIDDSYAQLSIHSIIFNSSSLDFNLDNLIVYFNPYYEKEIVLRLFIKCDMIQIPIYDEDPPFLIKHFINDYELFVDIKTFSCQLGEYFNSTSKICIKCNSDQSQYQVEYNATICSIIDEIQMNSVESEKIELKPKFWRAYFYSTKIEQCYHLLENCLGGWYPGDKSCAFGHIGALCEQCDLYNIRGDGHFSTSSPYKCSNCEKIEWNIITISLISIWTLISVLMSVNSTIDTINQFIAGSKLILFGVGSTLFKQSSAAVLIKVFTNYLQIIQTITTFQLKVPPGLSEIFISVGNPIEQVAYSLDCFLTSISDISIMYFRIIWSFIMAISYISTFFVFLAVAILLKKIKFKISMITTALIYFFIFLQPNIIQSLISLVSFRILSSIAWIQGNVAYQYYTKSHQYWLISFCLPILITFSLLIPSYMFYCIRSNRNHLDKIKTRETWGYLYNEYKLKAYYWEFIKIFQKELIIIFLAYYDDYIAIKAALVFLVIFGYSFVSAKVSPYMTGELNGFDTQSTTVCAVSIILGSSIYTAQNQNFIEIVYPFYIIIALINGWFLFKMIINIFLAYFDKLYEQIDKVKEIISQKFPVYLIKYPQAGKLLESKKSKLQRIQFRFKLIKQYLIPQAKTILKLKRQIEFDKNSVPIITQISSYPMLQSFQIKLKLNEEQDSKRILQDQFD